MTRACLDCLRGQDYPQVRTVVIDDGSTDDTAEVLVREYPEVTVLRGAGNLWWTGAISLGVEHVLRIAGSADYIVTQNNDTLFAANWISTLVDLSRRHGGALVGSILRDWDDRRTLLSIGPVIDWRHATVMDLKQLLGDAAAEQLCRSEAIERIDALPGRGTLIPAQVFRQIGGYRRRILPHYIADYEFAVRAKAAGQRLLVSTRGAVYADGDRDRRIEQLPAALMLGATVRVLLSRRSSSNVVSQAVFFSICGPRRLRLLALASLLRYTNRSLLEGVRNSIRRAVRRIAGARPVGHSR
jgi:GT2 family glycosyltransferase